MGIDDMIRRLEPLVRHRIPQRPTRVLQGRDDLLAAPRRDATDHMTGRGLAQDVIAKRGIKVDIATRITLDRDKGQIKRRVRIDHRDCRQRTGPARIGNQRIAARARVEQTQFNATAQAIPPGKQKPRSPTAWADGTRGKAAIRQRVPEISSKVAYRSAQVKPDDGPFCDLCLRRQPSQAGQAPTAAAHCLGSPRRKPRWAGMRRVTALG